MASIYIITGISVVLLICAMFIGKPGGKIRKYTESFVSGFWPGLILSALIFCVTKEDLFINLNFYHLLAAALGIAAIMLLEKKGFEKIAWLMAGVAAGSEISKYHNGAYVLTIAAALMLVFDALINRSEKQVLDYLFIGALLFLTGEFAGFFIKEYIPIFKPVIFSFGSGAIIYISSSRILPDKNGSALRVIGGVLGFLTGLIIY